MEREKYRSGMLTVLTLVYACNFMDRNVLGLLMQPIKMDLQLSDTQMGFLSGIAFAFFYATCGIPIARWADRGNRVSIIAISTALWSVMVIWCGMAATFVQLLMARIGAAIGEAGCVPPAQSLIADFYSRSERPRAMSYYMIGGPISVMVALLVAGWVNEIYGWRVVFIALGLPGLILTVIVWLFLKEPRLLSGHQRQNVDEASSLVSYFQVFNTLWCQLAYRHLAIGFTLIYLFSYGIAQWVPAFLIRTHHINTGELGSWYALIWGVGGAIGTYFGGQLAARHAANNERRQLRAMAAILCGFIPLYVGIYLVESLYTVLALMTMSALVYCSMFGPLYAMIQEVVLPNVRAMAVAIVLFLANLIGMGLGPIAVGAMSDMLRPVLGEESLRIALLVWTPGFLWAAFHLLRAGRYVQAEVAVSRSSDSTTDDQSVLRNAM